MQCKLILKINFLLLALILTGCAQPKLFYVPLSVVKTDQNKEFTTSDPVEKNRLLRKEGTVYLGITKGFYLPYQLVSGLERKVFGKFTLYSRDEGIAIKHPGVHDTAPTVLIGNNRKHYDIFFSGGGNGGDNVFHAISDDGYLWKNIETALEPSPPGPPYPGDSTHTRDPSVLKIGEKYYLYYTGTSNGTVDNEIFLATSNNGRKWVKYSETGNPNLPTPVIPNNKPDGTFGIGKPSALFKDGIFYLYYTDRHLGASGLYIASSSDGIHFNKNMQVAPDIENADVKYCPELKIFFMVYGEINDDKIYFNYSKDGIKWPHANPDYTIATGLPETIHHSPSIAADGNGNMSTKTRVFYSGGIFQHDAWQNTWEIESTIIYLSGES